MMTNLIYLFYLFMFTTVNASAKAKSGTNRYTVHSTLHTSRKYYVILGK